MCWLSPVNVNSLLKCYALNWPCWDWLHETSTPSFEKMPLSRKGRSFRSVSVEALTCWKTKKSQSELILHPRTPWGCYRIKSPSVEITNSNTVKWTVNVRNEKSEKREEKRSHVKDWIEKPFFHLSGLFRRAHFLSWQVQHPQPLKYRTCLRT